MALLDKILPRQPRPDEVRAADLELGEFKDQQNQMRMQTTIDESVERKIREMTSAAAASAPPPRAKDISPFDEMLGMDPASTGDQHQATSS